MAKMCVADRPDAAVNGWLRRSLISAPSSAQTSHRIQARGLAADRVHPGRSDFDVLPIADQAAKKPFRNRASTNITCADEEDVFHGRNAQRTRLSN